MKASVAVSRHFHGNRIFDTSSARDNCNERFIELKNLLKIQGIELSTEDINPLDRSSEIHIHLDADKNKLRRSKEAGSHSILIISESPIICKANQNKKVRALADKIFTWETNSIENHASWLGCGCSFEKKPTDISLEDAKAKKDLCIIIGNKKSKKSKELYTLRREAIEYFEKSSISFDLHGMGWGQRSFESLLRPLNKLKIARAWNYHQPRSYRGTIKSKSKTLQNYRFCLAFENARSENGYISEKIFDAMFNGCVPIYAGAGNIEEELPANTFINANELDFKEIETTIKTMSTEEYSQRIKAINAYKATFLKSTFYFEPWAQEIASYINEHLSKTCANRPHNMID